MLQAKWTIRNAELSAALCTSLFIWMYPFSVIFDGMGFVEELCKIGELNKDIKGLILEVLLDFKYNLFLWNLSSGLETDLRWKQFPRIIVTCSVYWGALLMSFCVRGKLFTFTNATRACDWHGAVHIVTLWASGNKQESSIFCTAYVLIGRSR